MVRVNRLTGEGAPLERAGDCFLPCRPERCNRCLERRRVDETWPEAVPATPAAANEAQENGKIISGTVFVVQRTTRIFDSATASRATRQRLEPGDEVHAAGQPVDGLAGVLLPVLTDGRQATKAVLMEDLLRKDQVAHQSIRSRPAELELSNSLISLRERATDPTVEDEPRETDTQADKELFELVLRQLEIHQEHDAMSVAESSEPNRSESVSSISSENEGLLRRLPSSLHTALEPEQLRTMLRQLRRRRLPALEEASRLVVQMTQHLRETAATLVRLPPPEKRLMVVGDLHGHLNDLLRLLDAHGEPSPANQYLFNGDFVDRGDWGPEVLFSLFCLRLLHPESIHLNRGNHECQQCTDRYGFQNQIMHTYPAAHKEMYRLIHQAFDQLPLCHVVGGHVFVVHGGLPEEPVGLAEIEAIPRGPPPRGGNQRWAPADDSGLLFEALLWSDPSSYTGPSPRGAGNNFGQEVTEQFLKKNSLRHVVRSHECVPQGMLAQHGGLLTTVFSASNYGGVLDGNKGRVAVIDASCKVQASEPWLEPYVKTGWVTKLNEEGTAFTHEREWDTDAAADMRAIESLQNRLGEDAGSWEQRPRARALEGVRRLVFLNRVQLLEKFEAGDSEGAGLASPEHWAQSVADVIGSPKGFPWAQLLPHLARIDEQGQVPYMEFLMRYDNPFSRELADRWCHAMVKELAVRHGQDPDTKFDALDLGKKGRLSYAELKPLIHSTIPDTLKVLTAQSMHVFALLRKLDPDRSGFVDKKDFASILRDTARRLTKCPQGHPMVEYQLGMLGGFVHARHCNSCNRLIPRSDMRRHCDTCDYDFCEVCAASGQLLQVAEFRSMRLKRKASLGGTKWQLQWDSMESAIRKLCQSHIDLRALFRHVDANGDGFVSRTEFVNSMAELFRNDPVLTEALWTVACEHCGSWHASRKAGVKVRRQASVLDLQRGDGRLRIEDFMRCVAVIDFHKRAPRIGAQSSYMFSTQQRSTYPRRLTADSASLAPAPATPRQAPATKPAAEGGLAAVFAREGGPKSPTAKEVSASLPQDAVPPEDVSESKPLLTAAEAAPVYATE